MTDIRPSSWERAVELLAAIRFKAKGNEIFTVAELLQALVDAERSRQIERDAKIAERGAAGFLSPGYVTGSPFSSSSERLACERVATAIRAQQEPKP